MECPACKRVVAENDYRCKSCNYGLRPDERKLPSIPRYLGDQGHDGFDNLLSRTYRCANCKSYGAKVIRIATTGNGITRVMDWQIHEFIVASCLYCGLIQHFDPTIVDSSSKGRKTLDFLFDL
ncbi:hypothetical protein GC197_05165 [bacterium]|nr:hypothetical protein [bacterium]